MNHVLGSKILLITNLFPNPQEPLRGVFVFNVARELNKRCGITVISPLPWVPKLNLFSRLKSYNRFSLVPREFEIENIKVYSPKYIAIPKMGFLHTFFIFIATFFLVLRLKKNKRIDLINSHWVFPDGVAASWIARLLRLPLILSARGCDINLYSYYQLRRPQIIGALNAADEITAISAAQKEVIERLGIEKSKIEVIKNGVDFNRFSLKDKALCRAKLGIDSESKIILFVGQIIKVKGFNYLLDAAIRLYKEGKYGFKIIAIGNGNLRKRCEEKVSALKLNKHILFVGEKSREEIPYWYGSCDLLCLPSIREGCPNVILEALASGRPVVASKVGGIPELINEGNGMLFKSMDTEELAAMLKKAMVKEWNAENIRNSVKEYTWPNVADRYLNAFEEVLSNIKKGDL